MPQKELIPNLFRQEFSKIVSVLCKSYGLSNLQLAEDAVSDTFLKASEIWAFKGLPDNPKAWIYKVSKNRLKDLLKRDQLFDQKIAPDLAYESPAQKEPEIELNSTLIKDNLLQMLFAVCHPDLPQEGKVALALRVLCGFGIDEIATALLSNKQAINKRLLRTKEKIKVLGIKMEFPSEHELQERLNSVLSVLYLMFNEGYYSSSNKKAIRKELCFESMRLTYMLTSPEKTNLPQVSALLSLFCFQSSRFEARINDNGDNVLYEDQNPNDWNQDLIAQGRHYLNRSAIGQNVSQYHLEASIAEQHTYPDGELPGKWKNILSLYNRLLQLHYSPIVALNRTYAFAKVYGSQKAIDEARKIDLDHYHFYHALLGELYSLIDVEESKTHWLLAKEKTKNIREKNYYQLKVDELI